MTTLNTAIFNTLRNGGASPSFLQAFESWVNRLPSFEAFRKMSQGTGVAPVIRFVDASNPDDQLQDGAHAEYRQTIVDPITGVVTKPAELILDLAAFQVNPTVSRLGSVLDDVLHEYRHHELVDIRGAAYAALDTSSGIAEQRAATFVNTMLDDETAARYQGYQVWKEMKALDPGSAGRIDAYINANPLFSQFRALETTVDPSLSAQDQVDWIVQNSRDTMAAYNSGSYRDGFAADAAGRVGLDGAAFLTQIQQRFRNVVDFKFQETFNDDSSGSLAIKYANGSAEVFVFNDDGSPFSREVTTPGPNNTETIDSYRYINGQPVLESRKAIEYFYDDNGVSRIETVSYPDGRVVRASFDTDGQLYSEETITSPTSTLVSAIGQYGGTLIDALSMLKAIQSGQPLPVVTSGLRLAVDLTSVNDPSYYNLSGAANVGGGILSLMSLDAALQRGDGIAAISSAAQTLSFAANAYADFAASQVFEALGNGTFDLAAESAMLASQAVAETLGKVLPGLNLVNSLAHGDSVGSAVALISMVPGLQVVGVAYTVFNMVSSLFGHRDPPPEAWGSASATWSGFDTVANAYGAYGGQETAGSYMNQFIAQLDALAAREQQLNPNSPIGVVANRLPSFSYRNYSGFSLTDIDPLTGVQQNVGVRYDLSGRPYGAEPGSEVGAQSFAERFIRVALERGAIAPLWEAQTAALQTGYGDPQAGLTEEERAGRNGLLATLVTGDSQFWRPVALDLNGDGIQTTGGLRSVAFDVDDSGYLKNTEWLNNSDGFLFLDRNLNGSLDSSRELFSNGMLDIAARGLAGMRWVDSNYDGSLNAADPVWNELKVWIDGDGDGQADAGEVQGLSSLGISSLNYAMGTFEQMGLLRQLASPDLQADTYGIRTHVVPEGIVVETSQGDISLLTTHIDDRSLLEANRDGVTSYEDIETIISTADLRANDTLAGWLGQDLTVTGVSRWERSLYV